MSKHLREIPAGFVLQPDGSYAKRKTAQIHRADAPAIDFNVQPLPKPVQPSKNDLKRIRQSDKPLMNKLESEYFAFLKAIYPFAHIRAQAKRFRLGNGIWYKPDFTSVLHYGDSMKETAWEVKGPHAFRGGFENLKVAASLYPEIKWILVWKQNGKWQEQEVLP